MKLVNELFNDEAGFVVSSELVLIGTILVIGMITGLATLRDGVIQELADLSLAIGTVSQTYQFNGVIAHTSATNGSTFVDQTDYCETNNAPVAATAPGCMDLATAGTVEGGAALAPNAGP